jgi:ATP synthase protein I
VEDQTKDEKLEKEIGEISSRKIRAKKEKQKGLWYGLGMFGLVGWAVSVPTLLAVALGIWIDQSFKSKYSWTLMLLVLGIGIGCVNAWYWITKESKG